MKKKIFSMLLCFVMIVGLMPTFMLPVLAEETQDDVVYTYDEETGKIATAAIYTKEGLEDFRDKSNAGETITKVQVTLEADIDFADCRNNQYDQWVYIKSFKGTFDGKNHTIKNLFMCSVDVPWDRYDILEETDDQKFIPRAPDELDWFGYNAFFRYVGNATIKNVTFENPTMLSGYDDRRRGGYTEYSSPKAIVAGYSGGNTLIENVNIKNGYVETYNNYCSAVVALVNGGTLTMKNVNIDAKTQLVAYWGTYDGLVGGFAGSIVSGAKLNLEDSTIAARFEVTNDVAANYQYYHYRYSGLIAAYVKDNWDTAITCNNVNVWVDEWNQIQYCEFESNGKGSYNPADEFKWSKVSKSVWVEDKHIPEVGGYYTTETANVHDAESHTANEDHHYEVLPFLNLVGKGSQYGGPYIVATESEDNPKDEDGLYYDDTYKDQGIIVHFGHKKVGCIPLIDIIDADLKPVLGDKAGDHMAYKLPEDRNYTATLVGWWDSSENKMMNPDDVFKKGVTYWPCWNFVADAGYAFDDDTVVNINGSTETVDMEKTNLDNTGEEPMYIVAAPGVTLKAPLGTGTGIGSSKPTHQNPTGSTNVSPKPEIEPEPVNPAIDDIPEMLNGVDHYAYVIGYEDGNVEPDGNITRAEVATIFFRLLKDDVRDKYVSTENSFNDVASDAWYNKAVSTLANMDIIKGDDNGNFNPNNSITRAEFAAIAARFDDDKKTSSITFEDLEDHWAKEEVSISTENGWVTGYPDGTFKPDSNISRAEAMTLVNRVLHRIPETVEDLVPSMVKWSDNADENIWYYLAVQEATNSHNYELRKTGYEKWTGLRENKDWTIYQ